MLLVWSHIYICKKILTRTSRKSINPKVPKESWLREITHTVPPSHSPMTRNRMRVAIQSVCVPKILALQRWSKIDFPPEFQTRQMHSFPIMYNTMGSKVDGLAVRDHFLPKNGLKTAILGDTILDRLTSERAGTQIFKGIANFSMCFEKFGTLSSKWAMGKASSFNIGQTTGRYFFGRGGHEKMQKTVFFVKR